MVFNRNCFLKMKDFSRLVPYSDLEGHSPVAGLIKCNSANIFAALRMVLTDTACHAVLCRWLSFLSDSFVFIFRATKV